ncbi:hypothetical protein TRFO_08037 [Tritrichomonas foetus]|uniref:Uncharacterized protein n=1 Tax=Tritrichomonas foetus TaxID=1144522 RepID=A0A1J4JRE0_9EUKA|nr:hypothetical protein TRFO_08037 [Tritrichomonas foetus]|eukprot:OHT00086.1 hypothetical protein TRFO_08037 [Tritrichomonas foetus]
MDQCLQQDPVDTNLATESSPHQSIELSQLKLCHSNSELYYHFHKRPKNQNSQFVKGITFPACIRSGCVVISHLIEILTLICNQRVFKIARPPGFGKSFLLDVIESIFQFNLSKLTYLSADEDILSFIAEKFFISERKNTQLTQTTSTQNEQLDKSFSTAIGDISKSDYSNGNKIAKFLEYEKQFSRFYKIVRIDFVTVSLPTFNYSTLNFSICRYLSIIGYEFGFSLNDFIDQLYNSESIQATLNKNLTVSEIVLDKFLSIIENDYSHYIILLDNVDVFLLNSKDFDGSKTAGFFEVFIKHNTKYKILVATCVNPKNIPFPDFSPSRLTAKVCGFSNTDLLENPAVKETLIPHFITNLNKNCVISQYHNDYFRNEKLLLDELNFLYGGYKFCPDLNVFLMNPVSISSCFQHFFLDNAIFSQLVGTGSSDLYPNFIESFPFFNEIQRAQMFNLVLGPLFFTGNPIGYDNSRHYLSSFLHFFYNYGFFTLSENSKTGDMFCIPNARMAEYLANLFIDFQRCKVNYSPIFINEEITDICYAIKSCIDKLIYCNFYLQKRYDFLIGIIFSNSGYFICSVLKNHFFSFTVESEINIFLINVLSNNGENLSDEKVIESCIHARIYEGMKYFKTNSKKVKFLIIFFDKDIFRVIMNKNDINMSNPLSIEEYEFVSVEMAVSQASNQPNNQEISSNTLNDQVFERLKKAVDKVFNQSDDESDNEFIDECFQRLENFKKKSSTYLNENSISEHTEGEIIDQACALYRLQALHLRFFPQEISAPLYLQTLIPPNQEQQ